VLATYLRTDGRSSSTTIVSILGAAYTGKAESATAIQFQWPYGGRRLWTTALQSEGGVLAGVFAKEPVSNAKTERATYDLDSHLFMKIP
jgi:hypothetical protein